MIKNPRTLGAAAVREPAAGHRFALTGTPLENHLGELWSIMQFVLPGLLGAREALPQPLPQADRAQPGTEVAGERLRALEARVRPFMLRRTKQSVLADLPPRTEIIQRIELAERAARPVRIDPRRHGQAGARGAGARRPRAQPDRACSTRCSSCARPAAIRALVKLPGARRVTRSAKLER